jgi:hypothetical protein
MGILLGLVPFCVFFVLVQLTGTNVGLWGATAVSAALMLREGLRGRSAKVLDAGTLALFTFLAICGSVTRANWPVTTVRTMLDSGLLSIMVFSLAIRRPFTLEYARDQVAIDLWRSPRFVQTNYYISSAWAFAMLMVVTADLAMRFVSGLPIAVEIAAVILALGGAFWFTKWYPRMVRVG